MLGVLIAELAELEVMLYQKADNKVFSHHCNFSFTGERENLFPKWETFSEYLPKLLFFAKISCLLVSTAPLSRELKSINKVGLI